VAGLGPRQHFEAGHPDEFVVAEGTHDNAIVKPGRERGIRQGSFFRRGRPERIGCLIERLQPQATERRTIGRVELPYSDTADIHHDVQPKDGASP